MTALAGYVGQPGRGRSVNACSSILDRLTNLGPHSQSVREFGHAAFGRALYRTLPEDDFDRQPFECPNGRQLLIADARVDNRRELACKLGLSSTATDEMSDSAIVLAAWQKWQLACFNHLLGDVALAVWDARDQRLTLARSPISHKPLFYHHGRDFVAFATLPQALHALPEIPKNLNFGEAAAIIARQPYLGSSSIFSGIQMVRHGHAVEICQGRTRLIPLWDLERIGRSAMSIDDCGAAVREELERSVRSQLRRRGGVAAQLSSGRDSMAVATTAAQILKSDGIDLLALTGAPHEGFVDHIVAGRLSDESALASLTAAKHPNMNHVVCRSRRRDLGWEFRRLGPCHFGPSTNAVALHWAAEVDDEAQGRGASIMLMGATGNFSISASGLSHFSDLLADSGLFQWMRHAWSAGGTSWNDWRALGSVSFGHLIPATVYKSLLDSTGRASADSFRVPMLRQPYRHQAESLLRERFADLRPPKSYRQFRKRMLLRRDNAEKMSLSLSGLDARDPTADRRLVELCLSFPPEYLVSQRWAPSKIYEIAFRDRIPEEVLYNKRRGYQGADWLFLFPKDELARLFQHYAQNPAVNELLDFDAINGLLATWPVGDRINFSTLPHYRNQLLGALACADFIDLHFPR